MGALPIKWGTWGPHMPKVAMPKPWSPPRQCLSPVCPLAICAPHCPAPWGPSPQGWGCRCHLTQLQCLGGWLCLCPHCPPSLWWGGGCLLPAPGQCWPLVPQLRWGHEPQGAPPELGMCLALGDPGCPKSPLALGTPNSSLGAGLPPGWGPRLCCHGAAAPSWGSLCPGEGRGAMLWGEGKGLGGYGARGL